MSRIYVCKDQKTAYMFKDFSEACDCGVSLALVRRGEISEADKNMIVKECSKRAIKKMAVKDLDKVTSLRFNRQLGEVYEYTKN